MASKITLRRALIATGPILRHHAVDGNEVSGANAYRFWLRTPRKAGLPIDLRLQRGRTVRLVTAPSTRK